MIRQFVHTISPVVARVRKSRRIAPNRRPVKVNFGSGLLVTDGWINVDGNPQVLFAGWPKPLLRMMYQLSDARKWCDEGVYVRSLATHEFVYHNLDYGLPFADESVDYLYSSHVLEHFQLDAAKSVLRDAHRVLKKGARLRICVPDLQHAFELYARGAKEQALSYFFEHGRGEFSRHLYMYDFDLLSALLLKAGFGCIERCAYGQGLVPDLDRLDNRPDETLYVEAVKP